MSLRALHRASPLIVVGLQLTMLACSSSSPPIFINEVAAAGEPMGAFNPSGSDWIELYNAGAEAVSLRGFRLHDKPDKHESAVALPADTMIDAKGFLVVYFNRDNIGSPVVGKSLGKDEEVVLYSPGGRVVDRVDWNDNDSPAGGSYGRAPDGGSVFRTIATPTPGKPNG
jgi:hypothetical protein